MQQKQEDTIPWYRQFWPWFLMALPATVVVAGIGTVILAVRTPLSLVEDDYYKEGLAINQDLSSRSYAQSLGLQADIRIGTGLLQIDLNLPGMEQLHLQMLHSTDSSLDREFVPGQQGQRRFSVELNTPLSGRYHLNLQGQAGDRQWSLASSSAVEFSSEAVSPPMEIQLNAGI